MPIPSEPSKASALAYGMGEAAGRDPNAPPNELTGRQKRLMWLWSFYACRPYENRRLDWDGRKAADHVEHEFIASQQAIPEGFMDVSGVTAEAPLKYRRPTAPYHLIRAIVNKFNGMLFSNKRQPKLKVPDDAKTEDWVTGFIKDANLWGRMMLARTYGGSMGGVGVGFKFQRGAPVIEVHDPRWCTPQFEDRDTGELRALEKKYTYQDSHEDHATGRQVTGWFWYRRLITRTQDMVWQGIPADGPEEPEWRRHNPKVTQHEYGFVPVVWVQNLECEEGPEGWTDAEGAHELQLAIDQLQSQAHRGVLRNSDPTPIVKTNDEEYGGGQIRKGSDSAMQVEQGGDVSYLEMTGSGADAAHKLIEKYRGQALEVSRCTLDANFDGPAKTEEEVAANYSSMVEACDQLRVQYGVAIQRLIEMVLKAARALEQPRAVERDGNLVVLRQRVRLTPKVTDDPHTGEKTKEERELGEGELVEVEWPDYQQHSLQDLLTTVQACVQAVQAAIVDKETALRKLAPYFNVQDVKNVAALAKQEQAEDQKAMENQLMQANERGGEAPGMEGAG